MLERVAFATVSSQPGVENAAEPRRLARLHAERDDVLDLEVDGGAEVTVW
jgi:hypothetical protein